MIPGLIQGIIRAYSVWMAHQVNTEKQSKEENLETSVPIFLIKMTHQDDKEVISPYSAF